MRYFKASEFKCPCCGESNMDRDFLEKLDGARMMSGFAYKITSGYRCERHNEKVGGKPTSSHLEGCAADLGVSGSYERYCMLRDLRAMGFKRFGIGPDFIHVDNDPGKDQEVIWLYI